MEYVPLALMTMDSSVCVCVCVVNAFTYVCVCVCVRMCVRDKLFRFLFLDISIFRNSGFAELNNASNLDTRTPTNRERYVNDT